MKYENLYDMHTHSIHSFDGNHSISALCKSAVEMGGKGIAVTDHCDIDGVEDYRALCKNQLNDLQLSIDDYGKSIDIIKGLEIGQGIYRDKEAKDMYNNFDYDFVLGSLHNLENMEDFYFLDYKQYDIYELLGRYFSDLLKIVKQGCFDSLAHLTYPLRYIAAREHIDVDLSRFSDITDGIFEELVKNKKALEINTSGLFMDIKDTLPNISYVKRFKELGGEYITVGSDSHFAERLFQGIEVGMDIAAKCGFKNITVYKKHEPILIPIE